MVTPDKISALISLARDKKLTVSTAESCTGGLIGKYITSVSGASEVYPGGVISYSNDVKESLLGVRHETLGAYGAVSSQTAREMASGVIKAVGADVGVSVTGIAGPTGAVPGKPVGTVFIAVSDRNGNTECTENHFTGNRDEIREKTALRALDMLFDFISRV